MDEQQQRRPYRVLTGSFQQSDENGQVNEFSRDDQVLLTEDEAAEHGGAVEPWKLPNENVAVATSENQDAAAEIGALRQQLDDARARAAQDFEAAAAEVDGLRKQVDERDQRVAALEADAASLRKQLDERDQRVAELEAAATEKPGKGK